MNFTIPATRYTKSIVVGVGPRCTIVAFFAEAGKSTLDDEVYFFHYSDPFRPHRDYFDGKRWVVWFAKARA